MLMSCFVSLCTGILIACRVDGMRLGLQKCFDLTSILRIAPINALFQVAFVLKFEALRQLDPDIVSMLSQANLVFLAIAARLIMQKKYSSLQWRSLVQITLSMFVYLTNRDGGRTKRSACLQANFPLRYRDDDVHHRNSCHSLGGKVFEDRERWQEKTPPFHLSKCRAESDETESARFRDDQKKPPPFWIQKVSCGCSWPWSFAGMYVFTVGFHPSSALWADSGQPLLRLGQMDGSCFDHGGFQSMAGRARGKAN